MSYMIEFRNENGYEEVMEKLHKAKKAIKEVCEEMESSEYGERGGSGNYRRGMGYRDSRGSGSMGYRDDRDWDDEERMSMRRGRGRYDY